MTKLDWKPELLERQEPAPKPWTKDQRRLLWLAGVVRTLGCIYSVVLYGFAVYGALAWWRS